MTMKQGLSPSSCIAVHRRLKDFPLTGKHQPEPYADRFRKEPAGDAQRWTAMKKRKVDS